MADRTGRNQWALLPLRLVIGFGFVAHGYAKLARGPGQFAVILHTLGVPAPGITAWVTTLIELIGGALVMLGAFVVPLSLPMAVIMLTALFTVHLPYGFASVRFKAVTSAGAEFGPVGYEINLLYLAGLFALAVGGSSPLSIDRWREKKPAGIARMRTARPTNQLDEVLHFYKDGLGLPVLGTFKGHAGYDGVILGVPGEDRQLELTRQDKPIPHSNPGPEDLLVLYYADAAERDAAVTKLGTLGFAPVAPANPYWLGKAITVPDPDGFRVVLFAGVA
jgi:putative oxidoreductase